MENPPDAGAGSRARFFAIAGWLPSYRRIWLRADIIAGVALVGLLISEGMGYAGIAGVPPQAGLYAALAGLFIYALFGSSRHVAVSATSSTAIIIAATVGPMAAGNPERYASLAATLVIITGLVFVLAWVSRLGFVSDFVAKPVVTGFVFGLALIIIIRQAPKLLGIQGLGGNGNFFRLSWDVVTHLGSVNNPTVIIGILSLATLVLLGRFAGRFPAALMVLVAGIVATFFLGLSDHGVSIVGHIPSGLPRPSLPSISPADLSTLIPSAAGIVLVAYAEGLGSARVLADRHRYEIDPNQELRATGFANIGSGLLGGIAVAGGLSGSSANDTNGAKTQVSTLTAAAVLLLTLVFLTSLFHDLPESVLAAIVIYAVRHMLNYREIWRFARIRGDSLGMTLPALGGVLVFGVLTGLALAVVLSLAILARELSRPHIVELGKIKETGAWVNYAHHPEADRFPPLAIYRINGVLFFASADIVRNAIRQSVKRGHPRIVVIDLEALFDIDATSGVMLDDLSRDLQADGFEVAFTNAHHDVLRALTREGLVDKLGESRFYPSVDAAVARLAGN